MPVTGKKKGQLSAEYILSKIPEYDIYRYYLGHDFTVGQVMISPFRKEENPSFTIRENSMGRLRYKDFSDSDKHGGCIDFVMQLFNEDYFKSLMRIDKDFGLGIVGRNQVERDLGIRPPTQPPRAKDPTLIQVVAKPFTDADLNYWSLYHMDKVDLVRDHIYSVKKLYLNREAYLLDPDELCFGYLFGDKWKIYRPMADKKHKWMTNTPIGTISGMEKMKEGGKIGLITKAKKDEVILSKIIPTTCSCQNESKDAIPKEVIRELQERFEEVWLNFDADTTGRKEAKYYEELGLNTIFCPEGYFKPDGTPIKDFADMDRYYGPQSVVDCFKHKNLIQ